MAKLTVWTLKSCDTCRKALAFLRDAGIAHEVRDVRTDGLSRDVIDTLRTALGEEAIVNRRSTTWRGLCDAQREGDPAELIAAHPTLLKRPAFVAANGACRVGFTDTVRDWLRDLPA